MSTQNQPVAVDLAALSRDAQTSGPQWGHECDDLDMTLLSWQHGREVVPHVNSEVDVVVVAVSGEGEAVVDGQTFRLEPGHALLIPKGCERALRGTTERFSYLSVHRRRRGLEHLSDELSGANL